MAYTDFNFKSKKAFKEAVNNGTLVTLWSPGPFGVKSDGNESVEGPHYPKPHTWYASVTVVDGVVTKVK